MVVSLAGLRSRSTLVYAGGESTPSGRFLTRACARAPTPPPSTRARDGRPRRSIWSTNGSGMGSRRSRRQGHGPWARVCASIPPSARRWGGRGGGSWWGVVVAWARVSGEVKAASAGSKGGRAHDRGPGGGWGAPPGVRREFGTPRAGRAGVSEFYTGARFASVASRGSPLWGRGGVEMERDS